MNEQNIINLLENSDVLLSVSGLKKYYPITGGLLKTHVNDVKAVDGISFAIKKGETLGLVGESGCGKSTAGRSILHLNKPTDGDIKFNLDGQMVDVNQRTIKKLRRHMQIVFQDPYSSLDPRMRVDQIIEEPLKAYGMKKDERKKRVAELLEAVGLGKSYMKRFPHEFSGGQRQRIGIARALALKPSLVICDEPVSALDVSVQAQVINLLKDLQDQFGLTYLFIAHDLSVVQYVSDRIAVMYLGKIVEIASSSELFLAPKHPYTEALLSAIPLPAVDYDREQIILEGDVPSPANPPSGCHFHTRCPYRQEICSQKEPSLQNINDGHQVACHFARELSLAAAPVISAI